MNSTESEAESTKPRHRHWVKGVPRRQKSDRRIPGLDGLRAISILAVIAFHVTYNANVFPGGEQGVTVFFVISGFLITYLLCEEEKRTQTVSLSGFYYRRAFRILPPALLYLVATASFSTKADFWHSVLFVRNFFTNSSVNSHFWSLSVEEQFYFVWPALFILLGTNRRRLTFTLSFFVVAEVCIRLAAHSVGNQDISLLVHPPTVATVTLIVLNGQVPIVVGCCLALLRNEGFARSDLVTRPVVTYGCIVGAIALIAINRSGWLIPVFVAATINSAACGKLPFLEWRPLAWIGQLSYSLYLWQQVFCFRSPLPRLGWFPLNVALSFAAAALSFYFVEKPALRLRDRLKRRFSTADLRQSPAVT